MVKESTKKNGIKKTTKKTRTSKKTAKKTRVKNELLENINYKNAEKLYKNKEYDKALKLYLLLNDKYPKNRRIYKRLIECLTEDYSYKEKSKEFKSNLNDYVTTYRLLATKRDLRYFEEIYSEYEKLKVRGNKSRFLLISFLGWFGIHKFLDKDYLWGVIYLLTFGLFGLGVIYDLINDFAEFEDDKQLDILRYIISVLIIIFGLFMHKLSNFYFFIIIGIIFMPIVYSKLLKLIPNIIKVIVIIILAYFGFKNNPVIVTVPANVLGTWVTENENTNFKEIKISLETSKIKFTDRDQEKGTNEYDGQNEIIKVVIDNKKYYKFKINKEDNSLCTYTEFNKCIVKFEKK